MKNLYCCFASWALIVNQVRSPIITYIPTDDTLAFEVSTDNWKEFSEPTEMEDQIRRHAGRIRPNKDGEFVSHYNQRQVLEAKIVKIDHESHAPRDGVNIEPEISYLMKCLSAAGLQDSSPRHALRVVNPVPGTVHKLSIFQLKSSRQLEEVSVPGSTSAVRYYFLEGEHKPDEILIFSDAFFDHHMQSTKRKAGSIPSSPDSCSSIPEPSPGRSESSTHMPDSSTLSDSSIIARLKMNLLTIFIFKFIQWLTSAAGSRVAAVPRRNSVGWQERNVCGDQKLANSLV